MQMKGGVIDQDDMCSLENDLAEVCIVTLLNVWLNISMFVTHSINLYHYDCVYMIRTNVAGRYETREDQMNFHFELFDKIYAKPEPGRHFIAIDFPQNHHHVKASLRRKIDNSMGEAAIANKKEDVHLPLYNTAVEEHTPDLPEWEK